MKKFGVLFFLVSFYFQAFASNVLVIEDKEVLIDASNFLCYIEDEYCDYEFENIKNFETFIEGEGLLNFGVSQSCFWARIDILNKSDESDFQISLDHPILDNVAFYGENGLIGKIDQGQSFYNRKYDDPNFVFDMQIPQGESRSFYFKVSSSELIILPLTVAPPDKLLSVSNLREMLFGLYAGIILVMFIYNLFVYFSVRDKSYLYYVVYILLIGLTQASLKGYTTKYLWPDSIHLNHYSVTILSCLAGIFALEFLKDFLHTKENDPKMHKLSWVILGLFGISMLMNLIGFDQDAFTLMQLTTALGSVYALAVAIRILRMGFRPAKFFLIAWSILLVGAIIFVLKDFQVLPYNIFTNYSLQVASILEVVLLSFALADKINIFRKEKEQSQLQALRALEENERIVREQNVILEAKVEERTAALKKANEDLNIAMEDLKNAQSKLVSAEKMASLGQLTAGIAHEINNPINYVKSSILPLKNNVAELLELIDEYESSLNEAGVENAKKAVEEFKQKIEFDYLLEETQDVINNIEEGANRTVEIVSGLRTFSHVDDIGIKSNDLNKGIKSTLNLLSGEIPHEYDIKLGLGDIPEIECYGGKINQVFMNILNNAIQAIKVKGDMNGELKIETEDTGEGVKISISDNGTGMDEETVEKIFDPFFTTKDVGEGTGLGLSVVYGIIESHNGSINVESELGKGTTFIINLPYIQPK